MQNGKGSKPRGGFNDNYRKNWQDIFRSRNCFKCGGKMGLCEKTNVFYCQSSFCQNYLLK